MKTKTILITLILCTTTIFSVAQTEKELKKHEQKVAKSKEKGSVMVSLDTIFSSGIPYSILKKKKQDYTLFSLNGKELIYIQQDHIEDNTNPAGRTSFYAFLFLESGKRGEVKNYLGLNIEDLIVENDIIKDNEINPTGESKFLMKNPPKFSTKSQNQIIVVNPGNNNSSIYQTVERNRNAIIQIFDTEIKQDFKVIGTVSKTTANGNGKILTVISFFLPNGTKIAEATNEGINSTQWNVVTIKDNQSHAMSSTFGNDSKDIAKYLSDNYYL